MFIDFEKAFDSVSWSFIQKALTFFNFNEDIKKWVQTFYTNANTCVTVNNHYSKWFNISRGVRQGDPLSPYLYLICAEVLSLMIRENQQIKGIKISEKEILLSQFADDTSLFLDGSEDSFREAINMLEKFTAISGLKMNVDKTQIVWIGSSKKSEIRYLKDRNFCWDPGIFKVLGVKFSTNIEQIPSLNYDNKLQEIQRLLNTWSKRMITPIGKICVLKSLAASKLTHLLTNLPDPPAVFLKALDKMFYEFLWDGKAHKVKKSIMCQNFEQGGLKMINIYTFLSTLKLSWLRRLQYESDVRVILFSIYPDCHKIFLLGNEFVNVMINRMDNKFWKDVLLHFKKLCTKCIVKTKEDFVSERIFYNKNILVGKKTVYFRDWTNAGVGAIYDLVGKNGKYLKFTEFREKFPELKINFLTYTGLISAIKKYQEKSKIGNPLKYKEEESVAIKVVEGGSQGIRSKLNETAEVAAGYRRWSQFHLNINWKKLFIKLKKTTTDAGLRWLQFRILHRILPTKRYLFLRNVVDSQNCTFCGAHVENIDHLIWECVHVQKFWNDLNVVLKEKCSHCDNLTFTKPLILFGISHNIITDKIIDFIILLAKRYIYSCKWNGSIPNIRVFQHKLKDRYETEKYSQTLLGNRPKFIENWMPYRDIVK